MKPPLKNFANQLGRQGIGAFLVTKDVNIHYLTGFPSKDSWLLVTPQKAIYITDFRYVLEARQALRGIAVYRYLKSVFESVADICRKYKIQILGIDPHHVTLSFYDRLKKSLTGQGRVKSCSGLVEQMRETKSAQELALMRRAINLNLEVFRYVRTFVRPGIREKEILLRMERFVKDRGACFSFDPIVASGPNACLPHAKVTDRKLKAAEALLLDVGIDIEGYKSDLTRIFFLGRIPPLLLNIYDFVLESQKRAVAEIRAGVLASQVDAQARNYLEQKKLGKFFGHGLGHGVGLEIHEPPRLSSQSKDVLRASEVVTVEPAVYLPGKFGIRVEDMVLVRENGCEVLSQDDFRLI